MSDNKAKQKKRYEIKIWNKKKGITRTARLPWAYNRLQSISEKKKKL